MQPKKTTSLLFKLESFFLIFILASPILAASNTKLALQITINGLRPDLLNRSPDRFSKGALIIC